MLPRTAIGPVVPSDRRGSPHVVVERGGAVRCAGCAVAGVDLATSAADGGCQQRRRPAMATRRSATGAASCRIRPRAASPASKPPVAIDVAARSRTRPTTSDQADRQQRRGRQPARRQGPSRIAAHVQEHPPAAVIPDACCRVAGGGRSARSVDAPRGCAASRWPTPGGSGRSSSAGTKISSYGGRPPSAGSGKTSWMASVPPMRDVRRPAGVVGAGRLDAVAAVDEHERRRRRPVAGDVGRAPDDGDDVVLQPGVVDRGPEERQRVHLARCGRRRRSGRATPSRAGSPPSRGGGRRRTRPCRRRGRRRRARSSSVRSTSRSRRTARRARRRPRPTAAACRASPSSGGMKPFAASGVAPPVVVHGASVAGRPRRIHRGAPEWRRARRPRRTRDPARPRADRGQHLPRPLARREPPAGVRRPGRRSGARRRGADRRRPGPARALAARLLPAPRRPDRADPLRGRPPPRRPQLHHPAGRRDPARPGDLQPAGQLPRPRAGPRPPDRDARRACPTRSRLPDWHDAHGAVQGPARRAGTTGRARSTCATSTATR